MASADSFTDMYQQAYPRVMGYLLRRVDVDVAREVADETFTRAWNRRSDLPIEVLPWLLVTARHVLGDQLRSTGHRDALTAELAASPAPHTPGADVLAVERVVVLSALAALSDGDRELLLLVVWDGLTTGQAAQVLGCSTPAAGVRLHRARRRFRDAVAAAEDPPTPPPPVPPRSEHPTTTGTPQPVRAPEPS